MAVKNRVLIESLSTHKRGTSSPPEVTANFEQKSFFYISGCLFNAKSSNEEKRSLNFFVIQLI